MLNWNSNRELDRASISNFKAPGLEIQKGNCSKLSFISDVCPARDLKMLAFLDASSQGLTIRPLVGPSVCLSIPPFCHF